mmetsp:Transcript_46557/g.53969  ORF Transcript_46557/g.53969 Transcript_46557/m.53969 type:complete len:159 (+) Transcript_46557:37-513(+)
MHGDHHHHHDGAPQGYPQPGVGMAMGQPMPNTVVYHTNQPQGFQPGEWNSGLFGCFSDIPSCLMATFLPCVQYGTNYQAVHKDGCCVQGCLFVCLSGCGLGCLIHMGLRQAIRTKFNINPDGMPDLIATCCCACCAIAQEAREIEHRRHEAASKGIVF